MTSPGGWPHRSDLPKPRCGIKIWGGDVGMKTREAAKIGCQDFCFVLKNTWNFLSGNWARAYFDWECSACLPTWSCLNRSKWEFATNSRWKIRADPRNWCWICWNRGPKWLAATGSSTLRQSFTRPPRSQRNLSENMVAPDPLICHDLSSASQWDCYFLGIPNFQTHPAISHSITIIVPLYAMISHYTPFTCNYFF